ncbi:MAG: acyl carrier protein, partial [Mastigocladus sp. ERB_26_1]
MIAIEAAIHHSQFNNHKIFENLQIIIAEQLGIEPKQISLASKFIDNLGADSLDMIEMFIVLEKAFNIQINHEVAQDISTVQKLVNYICQNLA